MAFPSRVVTSGDVKRNNVQKRRGKAKVCPNDPGLLMEVACFEACFQHKPCIDEICGSSFFVGEHHHQFKLAMPLVVAEGNRFFGRALGSGKHSSWSGFDMLIHLF